MNSTVWMGSEASELTASGLDQNEAFIQRVLGSTNDCVNLLDLDDRLTFMSEGGQKIMEVSDFNVIRGCPWPDFWKNQGHLDAKAAVQAAKNGKSASFIGPAETLAGNLKWWRVQVSPILGSNGQPEQILCVSHDRDRDRIWRLSPDLTLVAQLDGVISAVNPAG